MDIFIPSAESRFEAPMFSSAHRRGRKQHCKYVGRSCNYKYRWGIQMSRGPHKAARKRPRRFAPFVWLEGNFVSCPGGFLPGCAVICGVLFCFHMDHKTWWCRTLGLLEAWELLQRWEQAQSAVLQNQVTKELRSSSTCPTRCFALTCWLR